MTFDDLPWVVTMKKNEHYFPTMEWVKDGLEQPCGWRRVTYEDGGEPHEGEPTDGLMPAAGDEDAGEADEEAIV